MTDAKPDWKRAAASDPDQRRIDTCRRCNIEYRHDEGTPRLCHTCRAVWDRVKDSEWEKDGKPMHTFGGCTERDYNPAFTRFTQ